MERIVEIQVLDVPNKNGRIYPRHVIESAILNRSERSMLGMIGMPEYVHLEATDAATDTDSEVVGTLAPLDVSRVSHEITELHISGNQLVGKVKVLDTPSGRVLSEMLSDCDFRIAGFAQLNESGVISNLTIHSINAVADGA